ncbi:MAG: methionyl-tRNA formyltransferase [Betaproteobacteria bacterium]|nr:methionyl-tRNA formyltransferase [Betaproteobacteria bacterium]
MRVVFAGTPEFAARALEAILAAGHAVPLVLTQPDRAAGRGQHLTPGPVKRVAASHGVPVYQPERLRSPEQRAPLLAVAADVMVVAAYGLILPLPVLDHPRHGCLNIHASLLPRWRGAAPIQRAILAGDTETGICVMRMDAGLDTGPVVSRHPVAIGGEDTAGVVHDRLAAVGAAAIVEALAVLEQDGRLVATPQGEEGITYAPKLDKEEARIVWTCGAEELARQVRAFNPAPGAFTSIDGAVLKVWRAHPGAAAPGASPGQILMRESGLQAACGAGESIALDEVQPAGGRRMTGTVYANGRPDFAGRSFGT